MHNEIIMETGKQYKVYAPDGLAFGYLLDGRLYEYLTSTCIGFLDNKNNLVDGDEILGHLEGTHLVRNDGTTLNIDMAQ
jgi:hypothetical protein